MDKSDLISVVVKMLHDILTFIYRNDEGELSEKTIRTLVYIDKNGDQRIYKEKRRQ